MKKQNTRIHKTNLHHHMTIGITHNPIYISQYDSKLFKLATTADFTFKEVTHV